MPSSRLDWSEITLRQRKEIPRAIAQVMRSMEGQPYSVTDGFAVQTSATTALERFFDSPALTGSGPVRLRFLVSAEEVWIEIDTADSAGSLPGENHAPPVGAGRRRVSLVEAYMTSVEYRADGRQVTLKRRRGRGASAAQAFPPVGYDFQI